MIEFYLDCLKNLDLLCCCIIDKSGFYKAVLNSKLWEIVSTGKFRTNKFIA